VSVVRSHQRLVLAAWLLLSAAVATQAWLTFWATPNERLSALVAAGPGSNPYVTAMAVVLAWLTLGAALTILTARGITPARMTVVVGYTCLALLYINVMRERTYYGDFDNYFHAALNLREGTTLPARYLYPPLWASVLAPLSVFGEEWTFAFAWVLNLLSTFAFFLLLPPVLERYGLSRALALLVTLLFGVVNVPILRTLGYAQINMHVVAALLFALYCYPLRWFWSAAALALAVQLKISPLVLVPAFVLMRDGRWLASFALSLGVLALLPALAYGWQPYLDVLNNLQNISQANGVAFRDASIDSFVRATGLALQRDLEPLIWPAKIALAAACLALAFVHVRRGTFVRAGAPAATLYNAAPALLILMVTVSPLVWEHHPVFLALSYIAIATVLEPQDWALFAVAYSLEFLMPTFDFYPWSYGRLVSPLILLALAWRRRRDGQSSLVAAANSRVLALVRAMGASSGPAAT
jgi:hypothetical protein